MDISVKETGSVNKEILIKANREDLQPQFDEAYKKYKKQIQMPGFRPGKVPVNIIKQRFGDEIEQEEINDYIQKVYEKKVVPEYDPVGEPEVTDVSWEDDKLEATFKIGSRPEFELKDLENITVDQMVHDVSDDEVSHELEHALEDEGNWEEVEDSITETSKVTVDTIHLDEDGEPIESESDEDQVIDMRREEFDAFKDDLLGKKIGDVVDVEVGEEDDKAKFRLIVKKVEKLHPAKLTDEFAKEQSNGEAKNVDEYKALLKSRIQDYYDQTGGDLFKNEIVDELTDQHDFEVPQQFLDQVVDQYIQRAQQQAGGELPSGFDIEKYKEDIGDRAMRDAKWFFINEKLQEKFDDIEIEPEDVDEHLTAQAARYGMTVDQMRNMFAQNPQQLENLRNSIREEKVFDKLKDIVQINELSKEAYEEKREEKEQAVNA